MTTNLMQDVIATVVLLCGALSLFGPIIRSKRGGS